MSTRARAEAGDVDGGGGGERSRLHIVREKTFSWHNVCLISTQRPTATRVAGFQTWRTMGRFVRKGEKGIAIMALIIGRREAASEGDNARTFRGSARHTCLTDYLGIRITRPGRNPVEARAVAASPSGRKHP